MTTVRTLFAIVVIIVAIPLWGANHMVTVDDDFFSPAELTIQVGDTVTWTNQGNNTHNVVADDGSFRCANGCDGAGGNGNPSAANWSVTLTFDDPGDVPYFCTSQAQIAVRLWGPGGMMAETSLTIDPRGAIAPLAIRDVFGITDLDQANLYVTFDSDQPVFGYGSVVDNITNDPVFIPARMMVM